MKTIADLNAAVTRMHGQYAAGRMDRDILRGWVLGLPSYPAAHGDAVRASKEWFAAKPREITDAVRTEDLARLWAVVTADR